MVRSIRFDQRFVSSVVLVVKSFASDVASILNDLFLFSKQKFLFEILIYGSQSTFLPGNFFEGNSEFRSSARTRTVGRNSLNGASDVGPKSILDRSQTGNFFQAEHSVNTTSGFLA